MDGMSALESALWQLSIVGYAILLVKLLWTRLAVVYKSFCIYLAVELTRSLVLLSLDINRSLYGWVWVATAPVVWLVYILVVLEVYSLVLRKYDGLATVSRWALKISLGVAIIISSLMLLPEVAASTRFYPVMLAVTAIERIVVSSLVIFLLLVTGFVVYYRVSLARNTLVHVVLYTFYFLMIATALLYRDLTGHEATRLVSTLMMGGTIAALFGWLWLLTRAGESALAVARPRFAIDDEHRLLEQLNSINSALLRSARK